jgi:hypothetical protein
MSTLYWWTLFPLAGTGLASARIHIKFLLSEIYKLVVEVLARKVFFVDGSFVSF